jgi:hypothetical protein
MDSKHLADLFWRIEIARSDGFDVYHDFFVLSFLYCSAIAGINPMVAIEQKMLSKQVGLIMMNRIAQ